jgi:hypothetical protein
MTGPEISTGVETDDSRTTTRKVMIVTLDILLW